MVFDSTQVPQARISMSAFRRIFLTLAFLLSSFAPGIWAQFPTTLYVSPNGSDSSGGSQFSPFATIQHAIDAAVPGSTVIVLEGRYQGSGNVDLDFEGKAITVQSRNPTDPTCVKATILDAAGIGAIARFVHDEGPSTVFAGFTVVLGDQTRVVAGIPGYLEFSRYAHPTTRSFRLEKPVAPKSLSVHAMSQPVFGMTNGTPTGGRAWNGHNPWFQPAPTTDYWGSGDLDGDGVVTSNDATLALAMVASPSTATAAADVNGDGVVDNADVALIDAAVGGQSLPAWWNQLTTSAQRRAWMDKIRTLEPTRNYTDPVWWFQCVQFSMQAQFHGSFYRNDLFGTYFGGGQTWFNIPLYAVDLGIGHAINAILVGDNPLVMTDWEFIEPQGQGAPEVIVTAANDGAYFPSGTIVNIFVPDKVQVGATQYSGGHAAVTFVMGDNATYTVSGHDPDLVMTRPAPPAPVAPDNRPDLWNPHILSAGAGMLLYERQRPDLTRADDIFLTDLPFTDPPTGTPLVHDTQFTRLLDVARAPDLTVHLLWGGGAGYLPGLFHSVLNANNRTLGSIDRITPSGVPTANDSREIRGGRILFTHDGAMHALWSTLKRSGSATYVNGVYWSKWNGSSWNAEQNVATSSIFADVAGNWHDDDDARFFFDAVADQSGGIVLVWASADNVGNLTLKWCRYDGSSWGAPSDIEAMGVAGGVSLARDAAGLIHLVYWQTGANPSYTSFGNLMHRTFDGTSWSNADTVDSGGYASTPHMVATSTALYLVWQRNTGTQRVPVWRRWANSTWSVDHILSVPAGADAYYPTADVLSDGRVAMTWSSRAADRVTIGTEYVGESNLNVSVAHSGDFTQGDSGDQYQITVSNVGQSSATGTLTISDTLPSGLSATNISGNGWSCSLLQLSCTRSDSLAASASYPAITVVVSVAANAAANVTNSVTMASTDEALLGTNSASDPTVVHPHVVAPQLSVSKTHTGDFVQGQQGAAYTIIVSNAAQAGTTSGVITVAETAPSGLALIGMSGTGWTCAYASCTRSDALSGGASYPSITATVNVANSASSPQVNSVAVSGGGSASANTTDSTNITIASPASTPSFSPAAGTYNIAQLVSINDATPNATIYYTTNGSTPTVSSTVYSGPITVSTSETIKAFATAGGYSPSNVETVVYTITPPAATPTFSVNPGTYATAQSVAISDATPGASIYFTTNGSTPTTNSTLYTGPIAVTGSETIKAIATAGGYSLSAVASASYTISSAVAVPTFSPAAGTYNIAQSVSISNATPNATIYYTTNGSTPTVNSTVYNGPIAVSTSETIKAIAIADGYSASSVGSATYSITPRAAAPSFSVLTGTYVSAQVVTISDSTAGSTIYYTTDGSTPTTNSAVYSGPITVSTSETIKAFATAGGYSPSNVETVVYTITPPAATPTFSVNPGTYATAQSVAISDATPGASIYFTTNGSTPTTNSTLYTSPIAVTGSETIKAIATAGGYSLSAVASASYTISSAVAVPTFSPAAGTYTTTQTVSIMDATPAATIYYTADGSTPTHNSTLYTGPISVSSSVTLKAVATANGLEQSAMASAAYTIAPLSNLTYNLTRLDFGGQAVGTSSSAQTIIASNPNTTAIAITSIAASGDFVETSNCPSVPALGTCSINVTFSPAANGERNGTLTITNSLSNAPQSIGLTGRGTAPGIQVAPVSLNFGSQTVATTSAGQIVTIQNTGTASLAVSNIVTAGDFATSGNCGSIPAGSNCNLTVTFTPTASGMLTGSITITDNAAADNQSQIIALSGVGIQAGAAILPNSLTFPATVVGVTSFYLDTTLTNSGTASLTGITPSISGDFILTNNCPAALDAGKSCTLRVQYAPTIAGAESGSLTVSDSLGTQSVPLNGTGLTTGISLSATHLTFGGQRVNTASMAQTVILTNTGTATFKINSVESGNNFSQTTNCSGSLAPGASCSINVVFQPLTTGLLTAAITITEDTGAHVIGVQGQGISEGLIIVPSLGIFGAQEAGTISKAQTLIATNTGTVSLSLNPISVSSNFLETDNCPSVLQAGASCTISASFSPTATGTLSGSLVLSDASGAVSALAALIGQGTVPGLAASPSTLFFGSLPFGATSDAQIVTVTNTGTAPLQIGDVKGSGDFTEIDTCASKTIAPGAHCVISVTMTPTTIGMRTGAIQINNSVDGVHAVALSGMGQQAGVNVSPTSLAFGSLPVTSANQVTSASGTVLTVAVANTGNVPLLLSSISTLGDFSETDNCRSAVAVNSSCTITVKFVPTALGHRTGTLTISDNAGGGTQLISLEGEGSPAGLTLTPPVVSFGTQAVGTTSQSRTTTLANNTGQSISNLVITASGEYSETNDCGNTLVNGASCTLNITVTPATSGVITGTITISSGGNSSPAVRFARPRVQAASSSAVSDIAVVALKASTRPSAIGLSSPTLAFDATGVGATSISQTVTLQNTGSAQALTGLVISASNGAEFPYTTNCQGTLQPQATCTITVSFTPAAAGSRVGMVNVTSDGGLFAAVSLSGIGLPVVAAPIFSPAGGSFSSALTVTLSDATDGAAIYYTTDGTTPTTSSTRYSAPIAIPSTAILTAIATAGGYSNSAAVAATYTINIPANPVPVIGSLSPAFTAVGGPTFLLTVKGSGFTAGSTIYWGSTALVTQYVSATQITAQIAASAIAVAGTTAISVKTAAPGGGTSANLQFEADSAPSSATPPVFTSPAASITAGSTATYLVTLPSSATNVALNCLNLPTGASCSYSATDKSVSISTSSTTAKGTYQVTCVFTETESGAAAGFLWPVLLIPAWFMKRRNGKRRINFFAYVPLVLVLAAVCAIGCGGGSGGGSAPVAPQPSPTHQVTSSGVVSLTIQ